jgi:K+/H+ antiporter YhaU regulatory subunit KhtT
VCFFQVDLKTKVKKKKKIKMTNGFIVVSRDREMGGIYVETTEDWQEYMEDGERRMIYCQAVSDLEEAQQKIDQWLDENDDLAYRQENMNDLVAEMVSSMQWIANEHPLRSFRSVS